MKVSEILDENYYSYLAKQDRDMQRGCDNDKRAFKRDELEHELAHEDEPRSYKPAYKPSAPAQRFGMEIDGKLWKKEGQPVTFTSKAAAEKSAATLQARGKQTKIVPI